MLDIALPWLDEIVQAKVARRLPVVLTTREVKALLDELDGATWLVVALLYGAGMRLLEGRCLRAKDLDFERRAITVREGKGNKDRVTMLPERLILPLRDQWAKAGRLHASDIADGYGEVELPFALDVKYPKAGRQWAWQFVFPSPSRSADPRSASSGDITAIRRPCSAPSTKPPSAPPFPSQCHHTRCATPSPRTCCSPATTSAPCRNCSVTRASRRR